MKLPWNALLISAFLVTAANAASMKLTIYDDGKSCPAGCDAHVVIHTQDNGTRFAFKPSSSRTNPQACIVGQECRICFGEGDSSCMNARYRGGGPPRGTFDFTPAFYSENCARPDIPARLLQQCQALDGAVASLGYDTRIDCFAEPNHVRCDEAVEAAAAAQEADDVQYDRCISMGEAAYNATQSSAATRRSNACAYSEQRLGGPNSSGTRWRILLPGACRSGTFVGRDGLDCCSSDTRFAASVHPECSRFFPRPG